jgi:hypothetical protein
MFLPFCLQIMHFISNLTAKRLSLFGLILIFSFFSCQNEPCDEIACQNGGTCIDGSCECPDGYEGSFCEFIDISKYLGTYRADYQDCFLSSDAHRVKVAEVNQDGAVAFVNLGDYACPSADEFQVIATIDTLGFRIASQTVCADADFAGYEFSGQGQRRGDTLRLSFQVNYESDGQQRQDNCMAVLVKE